MIASRFSFAAIFAYRVWLRRWWYRLTGSGMAHQPVEVRTRPQLDVILWHEFAVIALARDLPKPVRDFTCFDAHGCLPARLRGPPHRLLIAVAHHVGCLTA